METTINAVLFWGLILVLFWLFRPSSRVYKRTIGEWSSGTWIAVAILLSVIIAADAKIMALTPTYNGEDPGHRNQYELITESFLNGHLYFDYDDIDPKLLEMENPYSYEDRKAQHVKFHWDHAFYNGKYYMYYGVVPVFLLFMPYRLITGVSLTTYRATHVFVSVGVIGLFALFRLLSRKYFRDLPQALYLILAFTVSLMSTMYSTARPALYMTAISAGVCLEVWSLYLFAKAVLDTKNTNRALALAAAGSLLGALVFGCRPTIGLINLVVLPLLVIFVKNHKVDGKLIVKIVLAALPYVIVAVLLMYYNKARFDSPFEFGQSYQLTYSDQSQYADMLSQWNWKKIWDGLYLMLFGAMKSAEEFPFLSEAGLFVMYPLFFYSFAGLVNEQVRKRIRGSGLAPWIRTIIASILLIIVTGVLWTPFMTIRYTEDYCWLLGFLTFMIIGFMYQTIENKRGFCMRVSYVSLITIGAYVLILISQMWRFMTEEQLEYLLRIVGLLSLGGGTAG